ncbi:MAG: ribonucleotide-diphosphate reductase subunit beta [Actinomycetota bacterium]|nr:ribonucleotide-diphosphate reductase subunit beta [Actinomycetota bacterium]
MGASFETLAGALGAPPEEFADLASADLLALLEEPPPDARTLYYRWERQQWEAGAIDLAGDRLEWEALDAGVRSWIQALLATWVPDGGEAQEILVSFADGVSAEEDQVFMTTQLADAARHAVAYGLVFEEVVRDGANAGPRRANAGLEKVRAALRDCSQRTLAAPETSALQQGLFLNNVVLEGIIGAQGAAHLLDVLRSEDRLRGLRTLLAAVFRDYARHSSFAIGFLQRDITTNEPMAVELEPYARSAASAVIDTYESARAASNDDEGGLGTNELRNAAMGTLARRLQDLGLDLP